MTYDAPGRRPVQPRCRTPSRLRREATGDVRRQRAAAVAGSRQVARRWMKVWASFFWLSSMWPGCDYLCGHSAGNLLILTARGGSGGFRFRREE